MRLHFISNKLNRNRHLVALHTPGEPIAPLNVYMSWCSNVIPPELLESLQLLFNTNPEFTFHIYNDEMCRNFIKKNYPADVLDAFDRLIPGAYKSDLWRYCILYKLGGVYLDIKYTPINNFKFIKLANKEHFVLDNPAYFSDLGLYNGLMIVRPNNPILLTCVNEIVKNVNSGFRGINALMPTGPGLLGNVYRMYSQNKQFDLEFYPLGHRMISYFRVPILKEYSGYRDELANLQKSEHYSKAWQNNAIYTPNSEIIKIINKKVKILVLRICNNSSEYDSMKRVHLENDASVFVTFNPNIEKEWVYNESDRTIYVKGNESYVPGILQKTIVGIKACLELFTFDVLVRSNISTVINTTILAEKLSNYSDSIYGGSIFTLNWLDALGGITEETYPSVSQTRYPQGTGIVMSRDVCTYLVENKHLLDMRIIDDVAIGNMLNKKYTINFDEMYIENFNGLMLDKVFYRNKVEDRHLDIGRMYHQYRAIQISHN